MSTTTVPLFGGGPGLYRATACHACTSHRVHHCPSYSAECHCRSACCRADCPSQSTDSLLSKHCSFPCFSRACRLLLFPASQPLHSPTTVLRPCLVIDTPDSSSACSRAGCSCSSSSLPASSTVHKSSPWMWPLPHPPAQRQPRLELDFLTRCMHDHPPARHSGAAPRAVPACPLPYQVLLLVALLHHICPVQYCFLVLFLAALCPICPLL